MAVPHLRNHFWRTVPELQLDERHPDKGWDTDQEDHIADMVAYGLVSRPIVYSERERIDQEYEWSRRQAFKAERGQFAVM